MMHCPSFFDRKSVGMRSEESQIRIYWYSRSLKGCGSQPDFFDLWKSSLDCKKSRTIFWKQVYRLTKYAI